MQQRLNSESWFGSLKYQIDKLDVDKVKTVPSDLFQLSNLIDNKVLKKTVYGRLVTKNKDIGTNWYRVLVY